MVSLVTNVADVNVPCPEGPVGLVVDLPLVDENLSCEVGAELPKAELASTHWSTRFKTCVERDAHLVDVIEVFRDRRHRSGEITMTASP